MSSTDPALLPASRQPVPVAPEVQAEIDRRRRSAAQIEREIAERTERLSVTIDELTTRLSPSRLVKNGTDGVRSRLVSPDGRPRLEVVGAVVGAALVAGLLVWRARRR